MLQVKAFIIAVLTLSAIGLFLTAITLVGYYVSRRSRGQADLILNSHCFIMNFLWFSFLIVVNTYNLQIPDFNMDQTYTSIGGVLIVYFVSNFGFSQLSTFIAVYLVVQRGKLTSKRVLYGYVVTIQFISIMVALLLGGFLKVSSRYVTSSSLFYPTLDILNENNRALYIPVLIGVASIFPGSIILYGLIYYHCRKNEIPSETVMALLRRGFLYTFTFGLSTQIFMLTLYVPLITRRWLPPSIDGTLSLFLVSAPIIQATIALANDPSCLRAAMSGSITGSESKNNRLSKSETIDPSVPSKINYNVSKL